METEDQIFNNNKYPNDNLEKKYIKLEERNWLPVTSSRRGKWWFSTVHNVTAIVGAGVLGLPYNMSKLGCFHALYGLLSTNQDDLASLGLQIGFCIISGVLLMIFGAIGGLRQIILLAKTYDFYT